jgi:hypothetical protein
VAVKVIKFRVRAGGKTYFPGDLVPGLDPAVEAELIKDGFCEAVFIAVKETESEEDAADDPGLGTTADIQLQSTPPDGLLLDEDDEFPHDEASDNDDEGGPSTSHPIEGANLHAELAQKDREELKAMAKDLPGYKGNMSTAAMISLIIGEQAK